jgi:asparagine synthase (glutamine-hydrolysing)
VCGIAGRVNFASGAPVAPATVRAMCDLIAHRGPDGSGVHCDGPVGFGHRRLAIIDLSPGGAQPMQTPDRALVITFNGEIYNYRDLRSELAGKGHAFRSESDTEVILAAYREWGTSCVERLDGMFALALWDGPRRRLFIARDRLGKKPLHYRIDRDGLAFASEAKAFLAEPGFSREVDLQAVSHYLSLQYVPAPLSAFKGVTKLPPAHTLVVEDGQVSVRRYWRLSYVPQLELSDAEAEAGLTERFRAAVRQRLISDVPLGAFLSGGIDSGLVVSFMAELSPQVRTFSIGFGEADYNELPAARLVAERYATTHTEFVVEPHAIDLLPQLVWHYGEPYGDSSALPTYILSELTRRHVTVALNGDAGDENFAGYDRYVASEMARRADVVPRPIRQLVAATADAVASGSRNRTVRRARRFLGKLAESPNRRYAAWMTYFDAERQAQLATPALMAGVTDDAVALLERAFDASDAPTPLERTLNVDVTTYLPDDLLVKVDIATMAHGLEGRSPLLDHHLMEYAARLPARFKVRGGEKKWLLRQLARKRLPASLVTLPKKGFGVPIDHWFRGELQGFARDVLLGPTAAGRGYYQMPFVQRMLDEHAAGTFEWHTQLWTLLMLELWLQMYVDRMPTAPPRPAPIADERPAVAAR